MFSLIAVLMIFENYRKKVLNPKIVMSALIGLLYICAKNSVNI